MSSTAGSIAPLPHETHGPRSFAWWGMAWLIATEATLFAALIASYFYLRFRHGPQWPPDGVPDPELGLPLVMSAILLSSSIPVHAAEAAIKRGRETLLRAGLAAGFVLGVVFFVMTLAIEWPEKLHEFTPQTNVYGSLYFTITGFHLAHVLVGLLMSAWIQARAWTGAFSAERHVSVQNFTMYWHFVDVVWVFVFLTIYLSPHL